MEHVAGIGLADLVRQITDALNPDHQHDEAAAEAGTDDPTPDQVADHHQAPDRRGGSAHCRQCRAAREADRCPPQLRAGDRHRVQGQGDLRRVLPRSRRPSPRPDRVVPPVHRGQQGRDHRPAGPLQPALRRRAHLRPHQGTGPSHRTPTPPLDHRSAMAGLRGPQRLQGAGFRPPCEHRPSEPRPPRPRPDR